MVCPLLRRGFSFDGCKACFQYHSVALSFSFCGSVADVEDLVKWKVSRR